ncbi:MAG: aminoacyl-tRNA hydrolase [Hyphomicrobiales bacterium]|nr:MAG: aminoacyl-tRNA hydrolase [Hyphomicrobiales bacterium]
MKVFVGLGNPGSQYERHRHNVGFMVLDRIADVHRFSGWKKRFLALTADGTIGDTRVLLIKPQTYMNESGQAVGEALRFLKIAPADTFVFHDELDLAPGKLKVKIGGGNAGHNGLRSISAHIGNEYPRVRIGIGHPGSKDLVSGYVLHDFAKADASWLEPMLDAMAKAAGRLADGDTERFQTDVARALQPPKEKKGGKDDAGAGADAAPASRADDDIRLARRTGPHPAGERQSKRASALAENLQKWLKGREPKS